MLAQKNRLATNGHADLLRKAAAFAGRPRERIVALMDTQEAECNARHHRLWPRYTAGNSLRKGPPSNGRDADLRGCEKGFISALIDVILDAIRAGDLQLPEDQTPAEKALAVCVLALGIGMLMDSAMSAESVEADGFHAARDALDEFLDTQGWRPLSTEWDYDKTRDRVHAEVLAEERRRTPLF